MNFHEHAIKNVLSGGENICDAGNVANAGTAATFEIADAKLFLPVITLLTEDSII